MKAKHPATKITGTVANPSNPSVKFTALEEPTITKIENGIKNHPRLIIKFLKNGKFNFLNSSYSTKYIKTIKPVKAKTICIIILNFDEIPSELIFLIFL